MPTTIKQALKKWEEATGKKGSDATEVKLIGVYPPIEKMDSTLASLTACEKLSLSTNMITGVQNLHNMKNLKILSLGRNLIKNLAGIEAVGDTLEQLWISYNKIEKLAPLASLVHLKTLYMAHNNVKDWEQLNNLKDLMFLTDLVFLGNPVEEEASEDGTYTAKVINILLALTKLDGNPVIRDSGEMEEEEVDDDSDSSELDEELYNDPATQEIIKTLVL